MNESILSIDSVKKTYGDSNGSRTEVLRGVSLTVSKGEFVGLMGSSGSGKTTLLNLIGGLDTPDCGEVTVLGESMKSMSDNERSRFRLHSLGFVFQFFNLLPNLTVGENIALPMLFLGNNDRKSKEAARAIAEEVNLGEKFDRMAHQLSGGEMQRVGLARALVHRPKILLADEPTGNLDSKTGETILDLIKAVTRDHDVTVLMVTHDPKAIDWCDRVVHMADGLVAEAATT